MTFPHDATWDYNLVKGDVLANTQLGGFPLPPGSPQPKNFYFEAFTGKGIWITRNGTKKLDAIQKFVQFYFQPSVIAPFVEQSSMVPPLKDLQYDQTKVSPLFVQSLGDLTTERSPGTSEDH
jgi:ABC-type glycerol-3-phosphate transport system substrate-binding protein